MKHNQSIGESVNEKSRELILTGKRSQESCRAAPSFQSYDEYRQGGGMANSTNMTTILKISG